MRLPMPVALTCLALSLLGPSFGCAGPSSSVAPSSTILPTSQVKRGELLAVLALNRAEVSPGQTLGVELAVHNLSNQPVTVVSPSSAKLLVRIWARKQGRWTQVKLFPPTAAQVRTPWTLAPGQEAELSMEVPVGLDWPTGTEIRLSAEPNGRPDMRVFVRVRVNPAAGAATRLGADGRLTSEGAPSHLIFAVRQRGQAELDPVFDRESKTL